MSDVVAEYIDSTGNKTRLLRSTAENGANRRPASLEEVVLDYLAATRADGS